MKEHNTNAIIYLVGLLMGCTLGIFIALGISNHGSPTELTSRDISQFIIENKCRVVIVYRSEEIHKNSRLFEVVGKINNKISVMDAPPGFSGQVGETWEITGVLDRQGNRWKDKVFVCKVD